MGAKPPYDPPPLLFTKAFREANLLLIPPFYLQREGRFKRKP